MTDYKYGDVLFDARTEELVMLVAVPDLVGGGDWLALRLEPARQDRYLGDEVMMVARWISPSDWETIDQP